MKQNSPIYLLFDIDGTLIRGGGAGTLALEYGLRSAFEIDHFRTVPVHGRTDLGIFSELLETHQIDVSHDNLQKLRTAYLQELSRHLPVCGGEILPGVTALLQQVSRPRQGESFELGILTGNSPEGARLKLKHFGLQDYFRFGFYGDQHRQRKSMASTVTKELGARAAMPLDWERVVVIGDTEFDVELGAALGARTLAVATGNRTEEELLAAGAHKAMGSLENTQEIVDWLSQGSE